MRTASIVFLTLLGVTGLCSQAAYSDDMSMPETTAAEAGSIATPARFLTMEEVESLLGAPEEKKPAVGEPPITRWVYRDYTVYFEHQLVLHSVINR